MKSRAALLRWGIKPHEKQMPNKASAVSRDLADFAFVAFHPTKGKHKLMVNKPGKLKSY